MPAGMVYCTFRTRSRTMVNRWRLSASSGRSKGYSQKSMTCDFRMAQMGERPLHATVAGQVDL